MREPIAPSPRKPIRAMAQAAFAGSGRAGAAAACGGRPVILVLRCKDMREEALAPFVEFDNPAVMDMIDALSA